MTGVEFLRGAGDGIRVVVRYRLHGADEGATDAVGYVSGRDATHIVVATVRGLQTIAFDDVILAKQVPPPPAPRR